MPYKDKTKRAESQKRYRQNKKALEQQIKELDFKLKALQKFVFEHHHNIEITDSSCDVVESHESTKGLVWVYSSDARREEEGTHE